MHRLVTGLALTLAAAVPSAALATGPPASLPLLQRPLAAKANGCDTAGYRAPMSGFVSVRLQRARGDWDLSVLRGGRAAARSEAFGPRELVQTWVAAGERLTIRGCRGRRASRRAAASVRFVDARPPKPSTPSLVRVESPGRELLHHLEGLGFDVTHNMRAGYADVVVPGPAKLKTLERLQVRFATRVADLNEQYAKDRRADRLYRARMGAAGSPLPTGRTGYRLPEDYQEELKQIVAQHPSLAKPVTIGESFQGRPIQGVQIGADVHRTDGRPVFFLMGLHHAREWPSAEIAMEFAWLLVKQYGKDPRITSILDNERVTLVPIVNVDGFFASRMASEDGMFPDPADSTGVPEGDTVEGVAAPFGGNLAYRRKNCDGPFPHFDGEQDYPCYYQWGVDPNRNYGQFWGGPGASPDPNTQVYRGAGQWSEPETQAVHDYSQENPVTTMISLHNVAALVLRPPGLASQGLAPDEDLLREVGDAMAEATGYTSQYGWQLYDTTGTTEDWNYQAAGTLGYTIEIGPVNGQFHMPYETGVVGEWVGAPGKGGMREALLIGAESAAAPANHSVIQGSAPAGRILRLRKTFDTPTSPICTFAQGYVRAGTVPAADCIAPGETRHYADKLEYTTTVPADGHYEWHVTPSSRPFVSGRYVPGDVIERNETFEPAEGEQPDAETNAVERTFTVGEDEPLTQLQLKLDWTAKPEDYDLYLYHVKPDGSREGIGTAWFVRGALLWTAPGEGTNPNGLAEEIDVDQPPAGTYVAQIVYTDSSIANDWTLTVSGSGQRVGHREPTGKAEAWTMTCEMPDGTVLESRQVVADRGQVVQQDLDCGSGSAPQPSAAGPPAGEQEVLGVKAHALQRISIAGRRLRLTRRGTTRVRIACSAAADAPCTGFATLVTAKRLRPGKWVRTSKRLRARRLILGRGAFTIEPGRAGAVKVRVSRKGRRVVARHRRGLRARVIVRSRDSAGKVFVTKRALRLLPPKRRR